MWNDGVCKVDVSMWSDGGCKVMCQCGVRWMWSDSGCKVDVSMWSDGVLVLSVHHCMCQCYMLVPSVNVCQLV